MPEGNSDPNAVEEDPFGVEEEGQETDPKDSLAESSDAAASTTSSETADAGTGQAPELPRVGVAMASAADHVHDAGFISASSGTAPTIPYCMAYIAAPARFDTPSLL